MAYESEHTKFMRNWLAQHPVELEVQQSGRALWWDRGICDLNEQARLDVGKVPQKPYYYDVN